jgi:hypothetical protein
MGPYPVRIGAVRYQTVVRSQVISTIATIEAKKALRS